MSTFSKRFADLSISKKTVSAPIVVIALLIVSGLISLLALMSIQTQVYGVTRDLAPDAGTAASLAEQMYLKRLQVKEYIKTSNEQAVERFDEAATELQRILARAENDIQNPQRVQLLEQIMRLDDEYNSGFTNVVVANMRRRNEIVNGVMNVKGPVIAGALESIIESARSAGNAEAGYLASKSQQHLLLGRLYAFRYLVDNDTPSKERVFSEFDAMKDKLATLLANLRDSESREQVRVATEGLDAYLQGFSEVVDAIEARNAAVRGTLDRIGPVMAENSVKLRDSVFASLDEQGALVESLVLRTEISIVVVALIAAVIGLLVGIFVARTITRPLLEANVMFREMAEGDLTQRLANPNEDEIGQLSRTCNVFGDKLQNLIKEISGVVLQLASAAEEMSTITKQTGSSVTQQRSETEQVANAISEMRVAVEEVSRNAEEAAQAARGADSDASTGNELVQTMIGSINDLATNVEQSAEVIDALRTESENIGKVLDVIKELAEQTNLLALNATIEAARAGEDGRGFAVVADEVRLLAQRTHQSTNEIESLISTLQSGASSATTMMDSSRERARSTVDQAQTTGGSLNAITHAVAKISEMNIQIASAATEQEAVTKDINRNIVNISELADHNASAADQNATASQEVARLGSSLQTLVAQFKV